MTTLTEHFCRPTRLLTYGSPEDLPSAAFPSLRDKILQFCLDLDDRGPDLICPGCGCSLVEWQRAPHRSHHRGGRLLDDRGWAGACPWTGKLLAARALRRSRIRAAGLQPDDERLRDLYDALEGTGDAPLFREVHGGASIGIVRQFHVEHPVVVHRDQNLADALRDVVEWAATEPRTAEVAP